MDSGPRSLNNKFVESGRKRQSESREKILVDSVKRKKLHMHQYRKHHRSCPNSMIDSVEFFLLPVVFLQPFALSYFLFCAPFLSPFGALYTTIFMPISPPTCESSAQSFSVPFHPSLNLLLLAVRLLVHCSVITSTLMRPES